VPINVSPYEFGAYGGGWLDVNYVLKIAGPADSAL